MELGLEDDIKGHEFLMVYTWYAYVQQRLKAAWTLGSVRYCCSTDHL